MGTASILLYHYRCSHSLNHYREQRELYEAAKVIQHAFRQYKARISNQRQLEAERNAAVVIQSYYRRYKQFCYFKKLHKAAVLIQKHFRMHKSHQNSTLDIDNSTHNEDCRLIQDGARIENNADLLLKEHQAATLIQHAFRGHCQRKRQAAARTIQKFMRRSRQKLRKTHESNDDASTGISPTTHLTNGGSGSVHLSST
ncbi:hypothetical protein AB6A40_003940 [Gnathostoma spinigerum]|uniref:Calmodulin-binding transcription activator 1 n=1 Tax=Gnathostoma spinigerum TaxID=75299 RepID=A0ABD6EIL8_9BILA